MEPSSLVLVAIIGVWAAYLVPHWVRRREELAQSRTPDRFSDGLRVLQRRRRARSGHRSGDAVLTSPRVVVDVDGELLYIPGERGATAEPVTASGSAAKPAAARKARTAPEAPAVPEATAVPEAAAAPKATSALKARPALKVTEPAVAEPATVIASIRVAGPRETAARAAAASPASAASASRPMVHGVYRSPAATAEAAAAQAVSEPTRRPAQRQRPEPRQQREPRELAAALASSHSAARRRAVILALLFVITVAAAVTVPVLTFPLWAVAPSAVLLLLHLVASRAAAIRSAEHLAVLREQVRPVPVARHRPATVRPVAAVARPAAAAQAPAVAPDRVARRAIAVGAQTWEPIPVPVPTYTLKPAVFRPEPPPLDLPAAASAAEKPRGALPRRAEEIERILALDADPLLGLQERKAVNG